MKPLYVAKNTGGAASALLACLEKTALKRGVRHFHLHIRETIGAALAFYEVQGYTKTGEILLDKTIEWE